MCKKSLKGQFFSQKILDSNLSACQIRSLGISTQRASFITWDKTTGRPFHNFITWKDMRAKDLIKEWNNSFIVKVSFFIVIVTISSTTFFVEESSFWSVLYSLLHW